MPLQVNTTKYVMVDDPTEIQKMNTYLTRLYDTGQDNFTDVFNITSIAKTSIWTGTPDFNNWKPNIRQPGDSFYGIRLVMVNDTMFSDGTNVLQGHDNFTNFFITCN